MLTLRKYKMREAGIAVGNSGSSLLLQLLQNYPSHVAPAMKPPLKRERAIPPLGAKSSSRLTCPERLAKLRDGQSVNFG